MPSLKIASNRIFATGVPGILLPTNWGHLQIVYGADELEVQAPANPVSIPWGGDWDIRPIQNHAVNTDFVGDDPSKRSNCLSALLLDIILTALFHRV